MKRPLTDYYSDFDIERMPMLGSKVTSFCFDCEGPIGQSHYRLSSVTNSTVVLVCTDCAKTLKQGVIQRRLSRHERPHMKPLTAKERAGQDRFHTLDKED